MGSQPPMDELPELPEFLTGHIDPFTGVDDGDAFAGRMAGYEAVLGSLAGAPGAESGSGGALLENPYEKMGVSRNAPCPCGSGKKYKHCHGSI